MIILEWISVIIGILGMIICFLSWFVFYFKTKKIKTSLSKHFYGNDKAYDNGLDRMDLFFMISFMTPLFIQYHLIYKRKGYLPMFKKGAGPIFPMLDEKMALSLINEHYRWVALNFIILALGLFWILGSGFFMLLAERVGSPA